MTKTPAQLEAAKRWRMRNPERVKAATMAWRLKNAEKVKATTAAYRKKNGALLWQKRKAYLDANPEKRLLWARNYAIKNAEKLKAYRIKYYASHKEKMYAQHRAKLKADPSKNYEYQKRYVSKNKDKTKKWQKAWRLRNPETIHNITTKRRLLIKDQGTKLTSGLRNSLIIKQNGLCNICKGSLAQLGIHLDHIIPITKGGPHIDSNIQLLCPPCNIRKSNKIITLPLPSD